MLDLLKTIFLPSVIETHKEHFIGGHETLMWFILISNAIVFVSYLLIPIATLYLIRKRKDIVYAPVFLLIGVFVTLCGLTHLMHIIIFFYSLYWLQAIIEMATAVASGLTFIVLLFVIPKFSKLTSPVQLARIRDKLQNEIITHEKVESELAANNTEIENSNILISEKNDELNRINNFMVGREQRITELEQELRNLSRGNII